ncbi:anthrone oxygenase family protein [Nonomuraea africana]|uniref:anthrone oxygenase family protein n=1 Tax=Nonomuraea africana TaxID=46171 RepID=UPI0033E17DA4
MTNLVTMAVGVLSVLLLGAMAGLFFAFSTSVMPGLDAIEPERAVAAMRSANRKILNPLFLLMFLAAPVAPIVTGVLLMTQDRTDAGVAFLVAGGVYVVGAFVVTSGVNVPMNNALEAGTGSAERLWADYSPRWQRWNLIRGLASFVALGIAAVGLLLW